MRFQSLTFISLVALLASACGEDVSSNRRKGDNGGSKQPVVTEPGALIPSGIHREVGKNAISYKEEINLNSEHLNIRAIPDNRLDDDGADGRNVIFQQRPTTPCGLTRSMSLKEKISDCANKNPNRAFWNGTTHAGSTEGGWTLVSMSQSETRTVEVWRDDKTGMIWSDVVTENNWCKASGNDLDASEIVSISCKNLGQGEKICMDYDLVELPKVSWRLPTRHDYLQADLDGVRFVLKAGTGKVFWTATTATSETEKRSNAWAYNFVSGNLIAQPMTEILSVRCIGTPNF